MSGNSMRRTPDEEFRARYGMEPGYGRVVAPVLYDDLQPVREQTQAEYDEMMADHETDDYWEDWPE